MNLVIDGRSYTGFLSAEVESRMDALARRFKFVASTRTGTNDMPFRPGQTCQVLIDGERVLNGFIERIEFRTDQEGNTYTISGRDRMADVMDSNLPGLDDVGLTVKQACQRVLSFLGVRAGVIDLANTGARPFEDSLDIVAPEPTDTAFDFLSSVAKRRQVLLTSDGDANLVITQGIGLRVDQRLVNRADGVGNNLVAAEFIVDHSLRFGTYIVESQLNVAAIGQSGGSASAREIAGVEATLADPDGIRASRVRSVTSESSYPPGDSRSRATWECNTARARSRQYVATVPSHRDRNGELWRPNTAPYVEDDFAGIKRRMLISGVKYIEDETGHTSILTMTESGAFQVLAEEDDGFTL